jgi:hypothetical protein
VPTNLRRCGDYQVDGELGRFCFGVCNVVNHRGRILFRGDSLLPQRTSSQWHLTTGFEELVLLAGATQQSYRRVAQLFNRIRGQEAGDGTPLNTLRDNAEAQGAAVQAEWDRAATWILKQHGHDHAGQPQTARRLPPLPGQSAPRVQSAWRQLQRQLEKRGIPAKIRDSAARHTQADYEDPRHAVAICIDDVLVKKQKLRRKSRDALPLAPGEEQRFVHHTVARIEAGEHGSSLVAGSVPEILRLTLATLLASGHQSDEWVFFTDGARQLQAALAEYFAWHSRIKFILDWHHLEKKCHDQLSSALRGRELRNRRAAELLQLLWLGLVPEAENYLCSIPASEIKNPNVLQQLGGYFVRNRASIPCYALRKELGLRNSSNPVERANDHLVAQRQKRNGTSWSSAGSLALAALSAVSRNGQTTAWLTTRKLRLNLHAA